MQPFQQRVVDEFKDLTDKYNKLREFFDNPTFDTLPFPEQVRMRRQYAIMYSYLNILQERIDNFM